MAGSRLSSDRKAAGEDEISFDRIKELTGVHRFGTTTLTCTRATSCALFYPNALPV